MYLNHLQFKQQKTHAKVQVPYQEYLEIIIDIPLQSM